MDGVSYVIPAAKAAGYILLSSVPGYRTIASCGLMALNKLFLFVVYIKSK